MRPRILIVGDQPFTEALRDDYDLVFANGADRALEIAGADPPIDLVLLDSKMPGDVCRRLRAGERTARLPIIVISGRNESKDQERSFAAGANDYLAKPVSPPLLLARVGLQMELAQARDLLDSLALIDPLTGIGNKRRFKAALQQEWRRSQRNRQPLSVVMLDVDFFDRYNQFYGRAKGDECLRTIADSLHGVARRAGDLVSRSGGGEFALVLPESNDEAARALLRKLLESMRVLAIPHKKSTCSDRVTITAAAVTLTASVLHDVNFVTESLDMLLAEAKKGGRNQAWHLDAASGKKERVEA